MSKDVSFHGRPPSKDSKAATAFASLKLKPPQEKNKRLTIDIPASLHRRMKLQCVEEELAIADVVRTFLEKRFPERKGE